MPFTQFHTLLAMVSCNSCMPHHLPRSRDPAEGTGSGLEPDQLDSQTTQADGLTLHPVCRQYRLPATQAAPVLQTVVNPSTRQRHIQLTRATKSQLETIERQTNEAKSSVIRKSAGASLFCCGPESHFVIGSSGWPLQRRCPALPCCVNATRRACILHMSSGAVKGVGRLAPAHWADAHAVHASLAVMPTVTSGLEAESSRLAIAVPS